MFYGRISLNSVLLLLLVNFVSGFRLELMCISLIKYQVEPHSSPWCSAACAAAIVHRNHWLVIVAKGFLKLPNLHMLLKQKSPSLPRELALRTFGELLIVFSRKVNLLYLLYPTDRRCCLLYLIKQNCLLKTFLRTLILMAWVSLYLISLLELI